MLGDFNWLSDLRTITGGTVSLLVDELPTVGFATSCSNRDRRRGADEDNVDGSPFSDKDI